MLQEDCFLRCHLNIWLGVKFMTICPSLFSPDYCDEGKLHIVEKILISLPKTMQCVVCLCRLQVACIIIKFHSYLWVNLYQGHFTMLSLVQCLGTARMQNLFKGDILGQSATESSNENEWLINAHGFKQLATLHGDV